MTVTDSRKVGNVVPQLPILGEPMIPEFANTLYVDQTSWFDVFSRARWAAAWMVTAPCGVENAAPGRVTTSDLVRLRELRDAVRVVLLRDVPVDRAAATTVINRTARLATTYKELVVRRDGALAVAVESGSSRLDLFLASIAAQMIDIVDRGDLELIRVCGRPACNMFFFRDHPRRTYCNEGCANADRQARYNQRLHQRTAPSTSVEGRAPR